MRLLTRPYEHHLVCAAAIYLVGLAIYAGTLSAPFVFDDYPNIRDNPAVRMAELTREGLRAAAFDGPAPNRPLANVTFALNYLAGGYDVAGYRLVNVIIHVLNAVLVYFLTFMLLARSEPVQRRLGPVGDRPALLRLAALLAGTLFVAHPAQTQAVVYVVQRMTELATFFYLGALLLYVQGRTGAAGARRAWLWSGALLAWLLALACKEIAATLPAVILLTELCFFRSRERRWRAGDLGYVALIAACVAVLAFVYLGEDPVRALRAGYAGRDFAMGERLLTELRVLVFYIGLILLPLPGRLSLEHSFALSHSLSDPPSTIVCAGILLGLALLGYALARRHVVLAYCIAWFFVTLCVESTFVGLELAYEHRLYLPMFAFVLAAAYGFTFALARHRGVALGVAASLVIALSAGTVLRGETWTDRVALWSDVVAKNTASARARNNLARALLDAGRTADAAAEFTEALRIDPRYAEPYNNLGVLHAAARRFAQAERHFLTALSLDPGYAQAHNNLGIALLRQDRVPEALRHLQAAVSIAPRYAKARANLAAVLMRLERREEACAQVRAALALEPGVAELERAASRCP